MKLENGEKIIFKVHPHWFYVVFPEIALAIFGFFLSILTYALLQKWIVILFSIAILLVMLLVFLDWLCINYYLTNLRLIEERGIIGKRIVFIPLDKVQDVTCKFGILGKILGFGDLEIESAGTYGKIVFSFIANPRKRKEEINKAILEFKANRNIMEGKEGK
jgi:uncharacterized membrane protein YdbT with pleckstrin-like domain